MISIPLSQKNVKKKIIFLAKIFPGTENKGTIKKNYIRISANKIADPKGYGVLAVKLKVFLRIKTHSKPVQLGKI